MVYSLSSLAFDGPAWLKAPPVARLGRLLLDRRCSPGISHRRYQHKWFVPADRRTLVPGNHDPDDAAAYEYRWRRPGRFHFCVDQGHSLGHGWSGSFLCSIQHCRFEQWRDSARNRCREESITAVHSAGPIAVLSCSLTGSARDGLLIWRRASRRGSIQGGTILG